MKALTFAIFLSLYAAILTFTFVSCTEPEDNSTQISSQLYKLSDHVYYISCYNNEVDEYYELLLSEIDTTNNHVVAVSGDGTAGYGHDRGWFVFIESKK